jgi:hypothetical protein
MVRGQPNGASHEFFDSLVMVRKHVGLVHFRYRQDSLGINVRTTEQTAGGKTSVKQTLCPKTGHAVADASHPTGASNNEIRYQPTVVEQDRG